ncbi:MAG TPA: hypothetical protein VMR74_14055 [Gammaproteobacteria bacterium]|nr:hypothetical protein [Gammaproteobacteria bacterium]
MNQRTLTLGAALLAIVIVAFGATVYFIRDATDEASAPITGPGRAAEARGIIAEIEAGRTAGEAGEPAGQPAPVARPAPAAADAPEAAAGEPADGGAIAAVPEPAADAPTGSADPELDAAFERARELQSAGQLDDAQVLFFFGARRGHARSAFVYAEMNDPNHHSAETSLLAEPDAFQAFRWYSAALEGGIDTAADRLDTLREWAETAAAAGDAEAERLLLQWEQ